jgi:hypothetical protein
MQRRIALRLIVGSLVLPALASCGPGARPAVQPVGAAAPLLSTHDPVWWLHPIPNGGVTAWFGPVVEDPSVGPVRLWTMSCAQAGTPTPLAALGGAISAYSADPVRLEGSSFDVELRPRDGLSWSEVRTREHLETRVRGLE